MKRVEFQFDFGSPNAWCAHKVIPGIAARTGAVFDYVPVLLGGLFKLTNNKAPMVQFAAIPNKAAYEQLELRRFIEAHGLPFAMNPHFPVNTLLLMRMATAARMEGSLAPFVDAAFRLMWEVPHKMDDPEVAVAQLSAAGIDAARLAARAQDDDVKTQLVATTEDAAQRGAFGSPTFFLGEDIYFGKNTLREIEERVAAA
jgi:2-hydroxychromene-2-carboxylate isomerase